MKIRKDPPALPKLEKIEQKLPLAGSSIPSTPTTNAPATKAPTTNAPLQSTSTQAPKQAGQNGAPAWATPEFFQGVAAKLNQQTASSLPLGGKGLNVRLGALTSTKPPVSTTPPAELKKKSATLLEKLARASAVVGGRPLTQDEIDGLGKTVHLTTKKAVEPILVQGLKPTTSVLANWSTWMKNAVYMFPAPPKKGSLEDKVVRHQGMTEVIEIDLKQLDPSRLYKRIVDGAIVYITPEPINAAALRHLGSVDDIASSRRGAAS